MAQDQAPADVRTLLVPGGDLDLLGFLSCFVFFTWRKHYASRRFWGPYVSAPWHGQDKRVSDLSLPGLDSVPWVSASFPAPDSPWPHLAQATTRCITHSSPIRSPTQEHNNQAS